jgi:hypothetical protein
MEFQFHKVFPFCRPENQPRRQQWHAAPETNKDNILLRNRQFDNALVNLREPKSDLNSIEIAFIESSRRRVENEQKRRADPIREEKRERPSASVWVIRIASLIWGLADASQAWVRMQVSAVGHSRVVPR